MEIRGISINQSEAFTGAEWSCLLTNLPAGISFVEVSGGMLPLKPAVRERIAASRRFLAVRELLPGHFIRQAREGGGRIIAGLKESFIDHLRLAGGEGCRWAGGDFELDRIAEGDRMELESLLALLRCFYSTVRDVGIGLMLDLRWPGKLKGREWNRQISSILKNLTFPGVEFAVNAHVHEAGAAENFPELLDFLRAWRMRIGLVRFHYEPELGNVLSARAVMPVAAVLGERGLDCRLAACPLLKDFSLLTGEAAGFAEPRE